MTCVLARALWPSPYRPRLPLPRARPAITSPDGSVVPVPRARTFPAEVANLGALQPRPLNVIPSRSSPTLSPRASVAIFRASDPGAAAGPTRTVEEMRDSYHVSESAESRVSEFSSLDARPASGAPFYVAAAPKLLFSLNLAPARSPRPPS